MQCRRQTGVAAATTIINNTYDTAAGAVIIVVVIMKHPSSPTSSRWRRWRRPRILGVVDDAVVVYPQSLSPSADRISADVRLHRFLRRVIAIAGIGESRSLIAAFTKPGVVVLDPFCGSGSMLVAAQELDRRFIGIELNADHIAQPSVAYSG